MDELLTFNLSSAFVQLMNHKDGTTFSSLKRLLSDTLCI